MLRRAGQITCLPPGISEEAQRPACRDLGVKLAQGPRRRIAWIGEDGFAVLLLPLVQCREVIMMHIDLAAHLNDGRRRLGLQLVGNILDGLDVARNVFTFGPVSARCGQNQFAVLITQRGGEPVDLGLGGEFQRVGIAEFQEPRDAGAKIGKIFIAEGIAERKHGHRVAHLLEFFRGRRAHAA